MKRRLFTILAAPSLLLFVAVVALWVRSYWVGDAVSRTTLTTWTDWYSWSGRFAITRGHRPPPRWSVTERSGNANARARWQWRILMPIQLEGDRASKRGISVESYRFLGFEWMRASYHETFITVVVPCWFPAIFLLGMNMLLLYPLRPFKPGLCPACGYDLRATPGRCPECGLVAEEARVGQAAKR